MRLVGALAVSLAVLVAACSKGNGLGIGSDCPNGFCDGQGAFTEVDAGDAEAEAADVAALMCVGTSCPSPYTTCPDTAYCSVDLARDAKNCGACGIACDPILALRMGASCVNGQCAYQCELDFHDCNGLLDDGCETRTDNDPKNCGVCGNACDEGTPCIDGRCGCLLPTVACGGQCVDTTSDVSNCGGCGKACSNMDAPCNPMPPHTAVGCFQSECGKLVCDGPWGDCDDDDTDVCASNGCETPLDTVDNCGACGTKCLPGQECRPVDNNRVECKDTCETQGLVECEKGQDCVDLAKDIRNCGGCNIPCNGARGNQANLCKKGLCEVECMTGFADCNGDPSDGCEVDVRTNAGHCGACGASCDVDAGQPCIDGKCLLVECDAGPVTK